MSKPPPRRPSREERVRAGTVIVSAAVPLVLIIIGLNLVFTTRLSFDPATMQTTTSHPHLAVGIVLIAVALGGLALLRITSRR
jgi:hypothetical protein